MEHPKFFALSLSIRHETLVGICVILISTHSSSFKQNKQDGFLVVHQSVNQSLIVIYYATKYSIADSDCITDFWLKPDINDLLSMIPETFLKSIINDR